MNFLKTLANVIGGDSGQPISSPRTLETATNARDPIPPVDVAPGITITTSELDRRVNSTFDRAIAEKNVTYIRGVSDFIEASSSLTDTSVSITVETPAQAAAIHTWCVAQFQDLIENISIQIVCQDGVSSFAISQTQQSYIAHLALSVEQLSKPRFVLSSERFFDKDSARNMVAVLKYSGNGVAAALRRVKHYVRIKASSDILLGEAAPANLTGPVKRREALYLAELLTKFGSPTSEDLSALTSISQIEDRGKPMFNISHALPPELCDALSRRMDLLRRRVGLGNGMWTPAIAKGYVIELRRAISESDPIDVAAIACEMWLHGSTLKPGKVAMREISASLDHDTPREKPSPQSKAIRIVQRSPEPTFPPVQPTPERLVTTDELSSLIKYDKRTIRERLKDRVLLENIHYVRLMGGRKILWRWDEVQKTLGIGTISQGAP